MSVQQNPRDPAPGVLVVEEDLYPHRWMSVDVALAASQARTAREAERGRRGASAPAPVPARRPVFLEPIPARLHPRLDRVPLGDVIVVGARPVAASAPAHAASPPVSSFPEPRDEPAAATAARAPEPASPEPAAPEAGRPEASSREPIPFPIPAAAQAPRAVPSSRAVPSPAAVLARASDQLGLSRAQMLLCGLLTLVVLCGAFYTAMRWTSRQAIIVPVTETDRTMIT